jgi:hypothetical protein
MTFRRNQKQFQPMKITQYFTGMSIGKMLLFSELHGWKPKFSMHESHQFGSQDGKCLSMISNLGGSREVVAARPSRMVAATDRA